MQVHDQIVDNCQLGRKLCVNEERISEFGVQISFLKN